MPDRDPDIVTSGLSRVFVADGKRVDVRIYRLEHDRDWTLEVVNDQGTSTVWDAPFDTDTEAFAAFTLTVDSEGINAFYPRHNVIDFPTRR